MGIQKSKFFLAGPKVGAIILKVKDCFKPRNGGPCVRRWLSVVLPESKFPLPDLAWHARILVLTKLLKGN